MRRAAVSVLLLALAGGAVGATPVAVLQLEDFAAEDALEAWELRQVAGQILDGRARLGYPHWQWWRGKWPATIL